MAKLPYLEGDDIRRLLPMAQCIALMEQAFMALGRGEVLMPLRTVIHRPDGVGSLYVMPAFAVQPAALAVKLISVFHGNHARGLPSHQGIVVVFDPDTGTPAALLDAAAITAIRTAAVSALATRLLARADARELCVLGSGVQAMTHIQAMCLVRPIERVRVWSPDPSHRTSFAERASDTHGIPVMATDTPDAAVRGADVVCTVTAARDFVLRADWLSPGTHVNAVGASTRSTREVDTETVRRARVVVDSRAAALSEAGDLLIPLAEGAIEENAIAGELGEVVLGSVRGRTSDTEITLFKSLGLAVEDAAAAAWLMTQVSS